MYLEKFEPRHYEMVKSWWIERNHPVLPLDMLSTFAFVSFIKDEPAAVAFLYMPGDCDFAQIGWMTTNPGVSLRQRHDGVVACTEALVRLAKTYNKTNVVSFCDSSGIGKIYQKQTFKKLKPHDFYYSKLGAL